MKRFKDFFEREHEYWLREKESKPEGYALPMPENIANI